MCVQRSRWDSGSMAFVAVLKTVLSAASPITRCPTREARWRKLSAKAVRCTGSCGQCVHASPPSWTAVSSARRYARPKASTALTFGTAASVSGVPAAPSLSRLVRPAHLAPPTWLENPSLRPWNVPENRPYDDTTAVRHRTGSSSTP